MTVKMIKATLNPQMLESILTLIMLQRIAKGGGGVREDGQGLRGAAAGGRGWGAHAPHGRKEQGRPQAIQESGERRIQSSVTFTYVTFDTHTALKSIFICHYSGFE